MQSHRINKYNTTHNIDNQINNNKEKKIITKDNPHPSCNLTKLRNK